MRSKLLITVVVLLIPIAGLSTFQSPSDFEHGVIQYATKKPSDPVARLQDRIDAGEVALKFDSTWGYLPAVLDQLNIPRSSQTLVFSKTSLQLLLISPQTPRALYFNDDVYIGGVWGGPIMEIASIDPKLGTIFYTLSQKEDSHPQFEREFFACLLCHDSATTSGVPGLAMSSVLSNPKGYALPGIPIIPVSDRTPFNQRWGGWFVTGTHGNQRHWGNLTASTQVDFIRDSKAFIQRLNLEPGANVTNLKTLVDTRSYLTPDSDLVALMVMAHQTRTQNLIIKTNYDVQTAIHDDNAFARALEAGKHEYSDVTKGRIQAAVEPLVRAMLFVWEAELTSKISGNTSFAEDFAKLGPQDHQGRSLREFDLTRRLFRYPLSYLVYSDGFDALPAAAKEQFYARLQAILSGEDSDKDFAHLSNPDRHAIREILGDTKPEFARFLQDRRTN
jgi:hypothetical protein